MKNKIKSLWNILTLLVAMILFSTTKPLQAQWTQTDGPWGGNIYCFVSHSDSLLFAGTYFGGVFHYIIGTSWIPRNNGLMNLNVRALAIFNNRLFAGTEGDGVFISTNWGLSWHSVNNGLVPTSKVRAFKSIGSDIFVGTDVGVFRSTNNGLSWIEVNNGLENTNVFSLENLGDFLFVGIHAPSGNGGGIYRSSDFGNTWTKVNQGLTNTNIYTIAAIGSDLFVGTLGGGVFRSINNGSNWAPVNQGLTNLHIRSIVKYNDNLYVGTANGLFRTNINNINWAPYDNGLTNKNVYALIIIGSTIYAGTWGGDGVFASHVQSSSWYPANTGFTNTQVYAIEHLPPYIFAGTANNGVFRSSNFGMFWVKVNQGLTTTNVRTLLSFGSEIYAGTEGGGVFKSTDFGDNWSAFNNGLPGNVGIRKFIHFQGYIFAATNQGIYRISPNNSNPVWEQINNGLPNYNAYALASLGSLLIVGIFDIIQNGGGIYLSTNNGDTWTQSNTGLTNTYVRTILINGNIIYLGTSGGVFRSNNNGNNWVVVIQGLTNLNTFALVPLNQLNLLVGTYGYGVFRSTDNVTSWNAVNLGLGNYFVLSLNQIEDYFAGTFGSGIWRRHASNLITSIELSSNEFPSEFKLLQNYPNPFNPTTTISFSLPTQSFVSLKIFDALGREMTTLVSEELTAGNHKYQWNAVNIPSGVYFYQLHAGSFKETKKLVLMK